ncbi:GNAT family N-acetyltransferase [Devosia rhodophyticola]|uniref:GNAT family N-acetyltransferase n=1 Tax=Devosia rhodophyticola TaxID=3026423 RepID=A0ABY7YTR3_9HYPH|nr:GNAT family N-acetyltransferase [Devosia rhodophyticola]WDR04733.1 GNAT family N-acetyltransferase [Devosia rhodophyticola]
MTQSEPETLLPKTINTERLTLAAPASAHAPDIAELANNYQVNRVLTRLPFPYLLSDAHFFIDHLARADGEWAYCICLKGQVIGVTSLRFSDADVPELGYWLGQPYWGFGYGTEAARALVTAARDTGQIPALRSRALHSNIGSIHVLEKVGFSIVGEAPEPDGPLKGQTMILLHQTFFDDAQYHESIPRAAP